VIGDGGTDFVCLNSLSVRRKPQRNAVPALMELVNLSSAVPSTIFVYKRSLHFLPYVRDNSFGNPYIICPQSFETDLLSRLM
jgi:hypothetical protein